VRQVGLRRASFRDDRCTVTPRRRNGRIEEKPQRGGVIQINVLAVLDSTYFFSRLSASTEDQDKRSCNSGDTQMLSKTFLSYCGKLNRKSKHSSTDLASQPRICISPRHHHQRFIGAKTRRHLWRQTAHGFQIQSLQPLTRIAPIGPPWSHLKPPFPPFPPSSALHKKI